MIAYIKRKLEKRRLKRTKAEFGYDITAFNLEGYGEIEFAQWRNPFDWRIPITQEIMDFYKNYIKKGDLVIDIGANTGDTSVSLALAAGKEGLTLAFDPNPLVFRVLQGNAKLNVEKARIQAVCAAITENDGEFYYNSSEATFSNGGISAIEKSRHGKYALDNKVKGIRLENYLNENHAAILNRLSFIKIDAEGYDKDIIRSISDLIQKYKPYIITECFKYLRKEESFELFDLIASKGYNIYYLEGFHRKPVIGKQMKKEDMLKGRTFDIFAMPVTK